MISFESIPRQGNTIWQVFYATQNSSAYQTCPKPPGASWCFIYGLHGGGGGGMGAGGAATVAPGGGGSGGSVRCLIPAAFLPDVLYVLVGVGGTGATTSGSGNSGSVSTVSPRPVTNQAECIFTGVSGGGGGGGAATNTAGTAGAVPVFGPLAFAGICIASVGLAGAAGAATANGVGGQPIFTSGAPSGGAGGGNGTGNGGAGVGNIFISTLNGGWGTTGGAGQSSPFLNARLSMPLQKIGVGQIPMIFSPGGSGGGGHTTGAAGAGGHASYGGGGGGGGNTSTAGGTAGVGGNGGDGLVIIGWF